MSRFRLFLAWLVMAAIPLQGFAAASMLFCGTAAHDGPAQVRAAQREDIASATHASGPHHHAKHVHANHGHTAEGQVKQTADDSAGTLPDGAHTCAVCASCCHSVAITEFPHVAAVAPPPQADLAEPFVLIHARPSPVPDKPPRA